MGSRRGRVRMGSRRGRVMMGSRRGRVRMVSRRDRLKVFMIKEIRKKRVHYVLTFNYNFLYACQRELQWPDLCPEFTVDACIVLGENCMFKSPCHITLPISMSGNLSDYILICYQAAKSRCIHMCISAVLTE